MCNCVCVCVHVCAYVDVTSQLESGSMVPYRPDDRVDPSRVAAAHLFPFNGCPSGRHERGARLKALRCLLLEQHDVT